MEKSDLTAEATPEDVPVMKDTRGEGPKEVTWDHPNHGDLTTEPLCDVCNGKMSLEDFVSEKVSRAGGSSDKRFRSSGKSHSSRDKHSSSSKSHSSSSKDKCHSSSSKDKKSSTTSQNMEDLEVEGTVSMNHEDGGVKNLVREDGDVGGFEKVSVKYTCSKCEKDYS